jgi:hypothetical protein
LAVERKVVVAAAKTLSGAVGCGHAGEEKRDPMKFMNGDDSLADIVSKLEASGKRITLPNIDIFAEAISKATWK